MTHRVTRSLIVNDSLERDGSKLKGSFGKERELRILVSGKINRC